mgnify:CR=1 FL=1
MTYTLTVVDDDTGTTIAEYANASDQEMLDGFTVALSPTIRPQSSSGN